MSDGVLVVLKCVYLMVKWRVCLCEEWIVVVVGIWLGVRYRVCS